MSVSLIPREGFDFVRKDMEAYLAPTLALSGGRENLSTVWQRLITGEYQMWMCFDEDFKVKGVQITRIEQYPLLKMLNLIFTGGTDLEDWHEELIAMLERFAKDHNCAGLEGVGRLGWKRFLKDYGWKVDNVICEKLFDVVEAQEENQGVA